MIGLKSLIKEVAVPFFKIMRLSEDKHVDDLVPKAKYHCNTKSSLLLQPSPPLQKTSVKN